MIQLALCIHLVVEDWLAHRVGALSLALVDGVAFGNCWSWNLRKRQILAIITVTITNLGVGGTLHILFTRTRAHFYI